MSSASARSILLVKTEIEAALLNTCEIGLMLAYTASRHRSVGHRLLFAKIISYFYTFGVFFHLDVDASTLAKQLELNEVSKMLSK